MLDVLIVGAGPVGLFLATECARRGLQFRIVETNPTQSAHSKALAVFPRTLEIFDMAGIVAPFLGAANRVTTVSMFSHQRQLATIEFTPDETPYRFVAMVPQDTTEKLLVDELVARGGAVEYETSFVAATEGPDYVDVQLKRAGALENEQARYVAGCDGSHSAVRHCLNFEFAGGSYSDTFMLADAATNEALPADQLQLCPNEHGPLAIFPMSATRRRIVATVETTSGDAPSLDFVRSVLRERAPPGIEATSLYWSSYFRIHHRQTQEMSKGRIFIAGDAAHIHSPFGGQGMNAGLADAWNLVWKLDLAAKGHAAAGLLESYSVERRPVVKRLVETTDLLTTAMSARNAVARAVRDSVIPIVAHLPQFQHAFVWRLSGLGISYEGSPIVAGHGNRCTEESLRDGKIASRFVLFGGNDGDDATSQAIRTLLGTTAAVLESRSRAAPGLALVRPDGYVAYESKRSDLQSVRFAETVLRLSTSI